MAARNGGHPLPPRPPLASHQSNSVPSTPHQHAREFQSRSRSPSPNAGLGLGSHSPRSVQSEGPIATLPKGRPACKYETSAAFSRRRMQYDIGDAPLENPKEEPKKALDPHEEKKLSGDMRELYDRLLPSEESNRKRLKFVQKLERILRSQWPDTEFKVHIFGSSGNLLCTSDSDVDICIQTPMKKLESMHSLADTLHNNGMERVVCIAAAKVPIVKIWDPEFELAADMNVNNTLALENTRMIKTYVQVDDRVRPLAMIIKHWTRQRMLNDAGIGGTLSSYAWICMIINFLQTRNPPILPALHQMEHEKYYAQDGTESGFNDDLSKLRGFGSANKETIGELLFYFFRFYAYEMAYDSSVISVRHGKILTRKEKGWDHTSKEGQWRLAIEEPFNTSRNLGNSADSTAFRGLHLELRQAFAYLADGAQLDKMLVAYEFPPEEKGIFQKPKSGPKPVLSAAIPPVQPSSRVPRGGGSLRGGRHSNSRQGNSFRRSSSGAAFGRYPFPFLNSPPIGLSGLDYMNVAGSPEAFARLQEQLLQVNGLQLEQLKAKFAFQEQQIRAAEQARNASVVHAHTVAQGSSKGSQGNGSNASPQKTPYLTGNSSPQLSHSSMIYPEYLYQSFAYEGHPLSQSISHDGARTNPSSPSLSNAAPRRQTQRTAGLNGSAQGSGSLRSQSQPARGLPSTFAVPGYPQFAGIPGYGFAPYPVSNTSQDPSAMSQSSGDGSIIYGETNIYPTPKEYVGYYVPATQPPVATHQQIPTFGTLPQIPQFSELAHRRNRQSQDLQLTLNGNRHASRSPSPLGHQRTFSIPVHNSAGLRSAPLPRMAEQHHPDRIELPPALRTGRPNAGPAVVNGSMPLPKTPGNQSTTSDEDPTAVVGTEETSAGFFTKGDIFVQNTNALGLSGFQSSFAAGDSSNYQDASTMYSTHEPKALFSDAPAAGVENLPPPKSTNPSPSQASVSFADSSMSVANSGGDDQASPNCFQSSWNAPSALTSASKSATLPLDTSKAAHMHGKHPEPKTAPVLSPVYETRSPSPTATRRTDHVRQSSINGVIAPVNGDSPLINGNSGMDPVPPTPLNDGADRSKQGITQPSANGQWQTGRKKNRRRSRSGPNPAKSASGVVSASAPAVGDDKIRSTAAPAPETERKGG
ncbi:uncharacterized protein PV09_07803 [Verruconis gallopava]|uniref:polynucleotide adenylyltransferase n=1 Tax=Verruconis gallopava TaxID=253628 RepID=A0A0D1XEJ9_9PEZI|nr:uncharacterized protein PV09_07803 [Verruconis gallopava]KIW00606.1 hypothetical protein PV09_07803 [Verruconis gallopava]